MASVLSGSTTVLVTSASDAPADIEAGRIRMLAVLAPERLGGSLRGIPTAREQGIDNVLVNWRGFYMAPDAPPDVVKFWERALGRVAKSKSWRRILEEKQWAPFVLTGDPLRKFLDQDLAQTQNVLQDLGLLR